MAADRLATETSPTAFAFVRDGEPVVYDYGCDAGQGLSGDVDPRPARWALTDPAALAAWLSAHGEHDLREAAQRPEGKRELSRFVRARLDAGLSVPDGIKIF